MHQVAGHKYCMSEQFDGVFKNFNCNSIALTSLDGYELVSVLKQLSFGKRLAISEARQVRRNQAITKTSFFSSF